MEKTKLVNTNTKKFKLLNYLYKKSAVFKQDLLMYSNSLYDKTYRKKISNLIASGYIACKKVRVNKHMTVDVAYLTEDGFNVVNYKYGNELGEYTAPAFDNEDKLLKLCNANHTKTLFNCAGIQTEPMNKPTLNEIVTYLNSPNSPDLKEVADAYKYGLYYSHEEFREYLLNYQTGAEAIFSVFKGIFISTDKCIVVYSNGKGNRKIPFCKYVAEKGLIAKLKSLNLAKHFSFMNKEEGIYALIVSDANLTSYSVVSGRKSGLGKKSDANLPLLTPASPIFDTNSVNHYNALYFVAYNQDGVESLAHLVSCTPSVTYEEFKQLTHIKPDKFKPNIIYDIPEQYRGAPNLDISKFKQINHKAPFLFLADTDFTPCVYMPTLELLSLSQIEVSDLTPTIITNPSYANVIQHITHKQHLFLDYNLNPLDYDDTLIYNSEGYIKGKQILKDYLHKKKLDIPSKDYLVLPELFGLTFKEFYNSIASGDITPEAALSELEAKEYLPRSKRGEKSITVAIPESLYNELKVLAQKDHITLKYAASKYLKIFSKNT